jgi:hypothetical protein
MPAHQKQSGTCFSLTGASGRQTITPTNPNMKRNAGPSLAGFGKDIENHSNMPCEKNQFSFQNDHKVFLNRL